MDAIDNRKPRHKWLSKDRQLLCLLLKIYQNGMHDITLIMNFLLASELRKEGFCSGMPTSTVKCQLDNMQQGGSGYEGWRKIIFDQNMSEARNMFREDRDDIEEAAFTLGISLQLRAQEPEGLKRPRRWVGKRAKNVEILRGVLGDLISSSDETENGLQKPKRKRRATLKSAKPVATPPIPRKIQLITPTSDLSSCPTTGNEGKKYWTTLTGGKSTPVFQRVDALGNKIQWFPFMAYRWYNHKSQGLNTQTEFRAGQFSDVYQVIPPPTWEIEAVANHLVPKKRPSPYISFRDSLLPCIFGALKAGHHANASIAVVDLQEFRIATQHWSEDAMKYCPDLVKKFDLKLGKNGTYRGRGEWLLYGEVGQGAILTTFKIGDILKYAKQKPLIGQILQLDKMLACLDYGRFVRGLKSSQCCMNYETGRAVGLLSRFLHVPYKRQEQFAAKFAKSWHLHGSERAKATRIYADFMNGVFDDDTCWNGTPLDNATNIQHTQEAQNNVEGRQIKFTDFKLNTAGADEQDLIDAQLRNELSSTLGGLGNTLRAGSISVYSNVGAPPKTNVGPNGRTLEDRHLQPFQISQYAKPRSSSLFTFEPPRIPGQPTDFDAVNSRDASPTLNATEISALHTFTTELLAKAEECSTVGSLGGRDRSTLRDFSEALVIREEEEKEHEEEVEEEEEEEEEGQHERNTRMIGAGLREDPVFVDLCSDSSDEGGVEDVDFEIVKVHQVQRQGLPAEG